MEKPACLMPWISIWPKSNGKIYPCCASDVNCSEIGDLETTNFKEIVNGKPLRDLRKQFLEGTLDSEICKNCIDRESKQGSSLRTWMEELFGECSQSFVENTKEDGQYDDFQMKYMDFVWSNKCNFKCVHCNPAASSAIAAIADYQKFYDYGGQPLESLSKLKNGNVDDILHLLNEVSFIHFNGGEPFIIEDHFKVLDHLIAIGKTDVKMWIHTNGSILKYKGKSIVDYLSPFKNLEVAVSHDGFGLKGQFVRQGYTDETFIDVVKEFQEHLPLVYPSICVHALNIWHIPDLMNWYIEHNLFRKKDEVPSINIITEPNYISFDIHDDQTKKSIVSKYRQWLADNNKNYHHTVIDKLCAIADSVENSYGNFDSANPAQTRFKELMTIRFNQTGISVKKVFPEYSEFFKRIEV